MPTCRRPVAAVAAALALSAIGAPSAAARTELPARFPAAGELVGTVAVRAAPAPSARAVRVLHRFRSDAQFQIVLALGSRRGRDGAWWYRLSLPGRPNGGRGWVRADAVEASPVRNRIVVRLTARRLEVRRVSDGRVLLVAVVAVGKPGAETPLGRDFYVASAFVPTDPFFGAFALETSAYPRENKVLALSFTDRDSIIAALDDPPAGPRGTTLGAAAGARRPSSDGLV